MTQQAVYSVKMKVGNIKPHVHICSMCHILRYCASQLHQYASRQHKISLNMLLWVRTCYTDRATGELQGV